MSEMESYRQGRADWDPGIGQSALPCGKDLFFNEKKNLQKKKKEKNCNQSCCLVYSEFGGYMCSLSPSGGRQGEEGTD